MKYKIFSYFSIKSSITIVTSTSELGKGGNVYRSSDLRIHPNYGKEDELLFNFDVGIIKLTKEMYLDGVKAKPVKLAEPGIETEAGTTVLVSGITSVRNLVG